MQHAKDMKASLSMCFVDFEKAFHSVSREAMGKVVRYNGVTEWLVKLVKDLHEGTFCNVMSDGSLSEAFEVKSVSFREGLFPLCCLSLLLIM